MFICNKSHRHWLMKAYIIWHVSSSSSFQPFKSKLKSSPSANVKIQNDLTSENKSQYYKNENKNIN